MVGNGADFQDFFLYDGKDRFRILPYNLHWHFWVSNRKNKILNLLNCWYMNLYGLLESYIESKLDFMGRHTLPCIVGKPPRILNI